MEVSTKEGKREDTIDNEEEARDKEYEGDKGDEEEEDT